jgi:hypothetical protein
VDILGHRLQGVGNTRGVEAVLLHEEPKLARIS